MKLQTKLYLGFGSIFLLLLLLCGIGLNLFGHVNQSISEIVDDRYQKVKLATDIRSDINAIYRRLTALMIQGDAENIRNEVTTVEKLSDRLITNMSLLIRMPEDEQGSQLINRMGQVLARYEGLVRESTANLLSGQKQAAVERFVIEAAGTRSELFDTIVKVTEYEELGMEEALVRTQESQDLATWTIIAVTVSVLLISAGITLWVIRSVAMSINRITGVMTSGSYDSFESLPRIEVVTKDEIGDISVAYNEMAEALEEHARHENEFRQAMEEQNWLKTKVAEITTMFSGVQDLQTLGRIFISKVTPIIGANCGVMYVKLGTGENQRLQRIASYALDGGSAGRESVRLGEGLVGQVAIDKAPHLITDLPENYLQITSGLGQSRPGSLLLLPVEYEGNVRAVVEFASFETISPLSQRLLKEVTGTLGITIHSILYHMKVEQLLKDSQALTEELQTQSEELQLQQEELRSINEQLEEQYRSSEQKTKELEVIKAALEEKARQVLISSKYKSEFLANMSHELRTPLNSLLILAQMLAENSDGNLTHKQVEFARTIYSSGTDLLHLINDILDLSKVESGKMEVYVSDMRLQELVEYVEAHFRPVARQSGLELKIEVADGLPASIRTDEKRLQQILKNLLANAFKFTERGSVHVRIQLADRSVVAGHKILQTADLVLALSVTDTGIGIPEDKRSIIFEAFRQADGTTSRKYGGTGLGLSISREIAGLLGGVLTVESVEGEGSTFTLYLPRTYSQPEGSEASPHEASVLLFEEPPAPRLSVVSEPSLPSTDEAAGPADAGSAGSLAGKRILIVDDDMRNVFALTTALESHGMIVRFAENGREGADFLLGGGEADLVLMDIMMPEMDGYEAMRLIRSHPQHDDLPIIALTAKAMKNDREKCIEAGASDYISKPVHLEQLFSLIRVWLYG